jgi:hypothetical protein
VVQTGLGGLQFVITSKFTFHWGVWVVQVSLGIRIRTVYDSGRASGSVDINRQTLNAQLKFTKGSSNFKRSPLKVMERGSVRFPKPQTRSVSRFSCGRAALGFSWIACLFAGFLIGSRASRTPSTAYSNHHLIDGLRAAVDKALRAVPNASAAYPLEYGAPIATAGDASVTEESSDSSNLHSPPYSECPSYFRAQPYKWANHYPVDPRLEAARRSIRQPTDEELKGTAIVTMATGDAAARGATALMQSLIDSGTRVPTLLVLVFRGGHGSAWCDDYPRKVARRGDMYWPCR